MQSLQMSGQAVSSSLGNSSSHPSEFGALQQSIEGGISQSALIAMNLSSKGSKVIPIYCSLHG